MQNKIKKWSAWAALVAVLLMTLLFLFGSNQRTRFLVDNGETSQAVNASLERLTAQSYQSASDPSLLQAVQQFSTGQYMAQTWLLDPQGKALYLHGGPRQKDTFNLEQASTPAARAMLAALPAGQLNAEQETLLKISSALQAEGDHGDVFHYRVVSLKSANGASVAYLAFAYDISPLIGGTPDLAYALSLLMLALCVVVYWLSLPLWVCLDARQHGERFWIWGLFTLMGNLAALIAYLLVRQPQKNVSEL